MADLYSYNGVILPEKPYNWIANHDAIYYKDETYHFLNADYMGSCLMGISKSDDMFFHRVKVTHWKLENGAWVKAEEIPSGVGICPKEDLIWSRDTVNYIPYDLWTSAQIGDVYKEGTSPSLVTVDCTLSIVCYGFCDGGKTHDNTKKLDELPRLCFGKPLVLNLHCYTVTEYDCKIETKWYVNGELVRTGSSTGGKSYSRLCVTAESVGTYSIYAVVSVSQNGRLLHSETLETLTATVVDKVVEAPTSGDPVDSGYNFETGTSIQTPLDYTDADDEDEEQDESEEPEDTGDDNDGIDWDDLDNTTDGTWVDDLDQPVELKKGVGSLSMLIGWLVGNVILSQRNGIKITSLNFSNFYASFDPSSATMNLGTGGAIDTGYGVANLFNRSSGTAYLTQDRLTIEAESLTPSTGAAAAETAETTEEAT